LQKEVYPMKKLTLILAILAIASMSFALDNTVIGKNGETGTYVAPMDTPAGDQTRSDVEYNTTGAMDTPADLGGSADGWGTHFITAWVNMTGQDVTIAEFGWPCGGPVDAMWMAWITDGAMPGAPGTETFSGVFTPASPDPDTIPPAPYTYIDVAAAGIVVPDGMVLFFGYENPGIGGQTSANGVETYAWYDGGWDPDSGWGRTAVLQFHGSFGGVAAESTSLSAVKALFN